MSSEAYRQDIDGLRAVAVLAVILYHFEIGPFRGGFVGVDIFFVISGYLITGIIHREIAEGTFRYGTFYERRVRRIIPALFVVLTATVCLGMLVLLPSDLKQLGASLWATLGFGANVFFWRQSGYFDASAELNPLLHTWSLSVEEQFYIGLPILLMLLNRHAPRLTKHTLTCVAGVSFALCVAFQWFRPSATFFLAPFRAWELMLGALVSVGATPAIKTRVGSEIVSAVALVLLLWSICLIKPGVTFPGWHAALPAIGTAGLLHAGATGNPVAKRLLSLRPLVFIGLISYSLYLWHWPLLVYAKYWRGLESLEYWRWSLLAIAFLFGTISFRFVEQPFRRRAPGQDIAFALRWGAAVTIMLSFVGAILVLGGGWPSRFPERAVELDSERRLPIPFRECIDQPMSAIVKRDICRVGVPAAPVAVLVWGDSHALAWMPALEKVFRDAGIAAYFAGRSACPPLIDVRNPVSVNCVAHNREISEVIRENPSVRLVVMAASWLSYSMPDGYYRIEDADGTAGNAKVFGDALRRTVATLKKDARAVWILGPVPGAPADAPQALAMSAMREEAYLLPLPTSAREFKAEASYFYRAIALLPRDSMLTISDPEPWLCDARICRYHLNGLPLYRDAGHLNVRGAAYLVPWLAADFAGHRNLAMLSRSSAP